MFFIINKSSIDQTEIVFSALHLLYTCDLKVIHKIIVLFPRCKIEFFLQIIILIVKYHHHIAETFK